MSLVHSQIPVTRLAIGDREAELLLQTLRSGWLIEGEQTRAFEAAVAAWTGARHAIATSSGTTALHLALLLAGIGPGDEVIVPSLSFIASANVVRHVGARPVFVDVRPDTLNLDERLIEASLSPRTRAILPVHQIGVPAEMDAIEAIAARHGLAVIEDAACALGSRYRGREIGSWSRLACLSFHPRKVITTGEGGMLLTADDALAERARRLVNHGEAGSALERHVAGASVGYNYVDVGYNYRLTNLQGALGAAPSAGGALRCRICRPGRRSCPATSGAPGAELPVLSRLDHAGEPPAARPAHPAAEGAGHLYPGGDHGDPPRAGLCWLGGRGAASLDRARGRRNPHPAALSTDDRAGAGCCDRGRARGDHIALAVGC